MKIFIFIFLFSFLGHAAPPTHWDYLVELSNQHEFYKENELIIRPKDSWQSMFDFIYIDRNFKTLKDCVYFRVPGNEAGVLKVKTVSREEKCRDFLLSPGDKEWKDIKTFQFNSGENKLVFDIGFQGFRSEIWEIRFQPKPVQKEAGMSLSSAEFKSSKFFLLAPVHTKSETSTVAFPPADSLCHNINDDCQEVSQTTCHDCREGWYEVPNGCSQGPKYCGRHLCGSKGRPACRRGMEWQGKEEPFDCRTDSSFAYCNNGLSVQCEGLKAYCR